MKRCLGYKECIKLYVSGPVSPDDLHDDERDTLSQHQSYEFPTLEQGYINHKKRGYHDYLVIAGLMYSMIKGKQHGEDKIIVNDFITMGDEKEFRQDSHLYPSIEYMLLYSRYWSCTGDSRRDIPIEFLRGYEVPDDEKERWEEFKYTVCLNACYYKIMNDEELKEWLLSTGNKSLVYISDDVWGGESNLFGFALMELRDEIRRLYENEDLIDWEYTEYLKNAYPYVDHHKNPLDDPQSAEYNVYRTILLDASRYVRDANLKDELAERYEPGQIITEKAFVDASNRIGGMAASHRYLFLSGYFANLSGFEHGTNWGLHTAKNGSRFKVLDIFRVEDKTQILLLQLPEGFEEVFEGTIDLVDQIIERERRNFEDDLKKDVIPELATDEWLERCSFPIGMNDDGEFF